jgi:hypothetical protein
LEIPRLESREPKPRMVRGKLRGKQDESGAKVALLSDCAGDMDDWCDEPVCVACARSGAKYRCAGAERNEGRGIAERDR